MVLNAQNVTTDKNCKTHSTFTLNFCHEASWLGCNNSNKANALKPRKGVVAVWCMGLDGNATKHNVLKAQVINLLSSAGVVKP